MTKLKTRIIFAVVFLFSIFVQADLKDSREALIREYNYLASRVKAQPNLNYDNDFRDLGSYILAHESLKKLATADGSHNAESVKKSAEILLDHRNNQCNRNQSKIFCDDYKVKLAEYKAKYSVEYKPVEFQYPKIDLDAYTYTLSDGQVFDIMKNIKIADNVQNLKNNELTGQDKLSEDKVEYFGEENEKDRSYECEWVPGIPRKILSGIGCKSKVCSAEVVCKIKGRISKRTASCSDQLCGQGQATDCAKQLGYNSYAVNFGSTKTAPSKTGNSNQKTNK